jgi:hypothetical protein
MAISFKQALIDVWRQVLVEKTDMVVLGGERYPFVKLPSAISGKWTLCSTGTRFEGLSRTRI